ncbi:MAG: transglycosylase domain-containing protein [Gemmatimonadetes bacterium]|nr:transglycosylase domain-containing protein [Gemmatimonadota bacterium]
MLSEYIRTIRSRAGHALARLHGRELGESPDGTTVARRKRTLKVLAALALFAFVVAVLLVVELHASLLQAFYFTRQARAMTYRVGPGPSESVWFPASGPYDDRLGYTRLPALIERLAFRGFEVTRQARISPSLQRVVNLGIFPIYTEKSQAGLEILDRHGDLLARSSHPQRTYATFEEIPPLVWRTLLYIENRELLDARYPRRNPAVEWDRLARASLDLALHKVGFERKVPGASTLATQIEKFRHSPEGRTSAPDQKLRQMASASLRSYLDGPGTLGRQRRIVLDYLNSVPLAGIRGYGEVIGLGDGSWAWYGADFDEMNRLLRAEPEDHPARRAQALAYRRVVSLLVAQRRPSYYLMMSDGRANLKQQTDQYVRLLATGGVISAELAREVQELDAGLAERAEGRGPVPYVERKAANDIRVYLLDLLGVSSLYELDRVDAKVRTTYDRNAQEAVTLLLKSLKDPEQLQALGLVGPRLLGEVDPNRVTVSVTLLERTAEGNAIRVQADNFDGPLSVNYGTKLDLGSTAKLRTLVNYLEIIEQLHQRYAGRPVNELRQADADPSDRLSRWAIDHLLRGPDSSLEEMLNASLERRYSASPRESFFTGGGVHTFANFDRTFDNQSLSVLEGFRNSVNLVFVRLMRDIVNYYMFQVPGSAAQLLQDASDPRRAEYLARFADREGRTFLSRFYRQYRGKRGDEILASLVDGRRLAPQRLARAFRSVLPDAGLDELAAFLNGRTGTTIVAEPALAQLYRRSDSSNLTLVDQGYLAGIHPLELWVARYLLENPDADLPEIIAASEAQRGEVYGWLFRTRSRAAQDVRIRTLLEIEAFLEIHAAWQRLGYPFEDLVPSYASAIGSSADRPLALAELVGIIENDGMRYPLVRVDALEFGERTPYETVMHPLAQPGSRVLSSDVARVARRALIDVVERGTGRRAYGAFQTANGSPVTIGGKTGTGDSRVKIFAPGGRLIDSKAVHRTSTFVFFIGDRLFGTITAFVEGPEAADYTFTSALPAQLLKVLGPALSHLLESPHSSESDLAETG